ncbi:MAG: HEPN domain-containing protein [Methanoregula sp.]|nr:HEPN domain-containing protein [Methanoregula sp.]
MKFIYEESNNANKWLIMAKEDLKLARLGQERNDIRFELFCYHCQQAAEKSLKALLIFKIGKYPKTHSLDELIKNLEENNIVVPDNIKKEALSTTHYGGSSMLFDLIFDFPLSGLIFPKSKITLNDHAEKDRYPRNHLPIDDYAFKQSLGKADAIIAWVEQYIQNDSQEQ